MRLWSAWFNPNSFYSYCAVVPIISGILIWQRLSIPGYRIKDFLFPVFFLVFTFPLPDAWTAAGSHHLKFLAAGLATFILNVFSFHAMQKGSTIEMARGSIVVNDACSGIRAILSLLAMGSLFAYWMKTSLPRKTALMCAVIPIALVVNAIRIVFLSIVTEVWGAKYTVGLVHDAAGFLLYGLAFVFLFFLSKILVHGVMFFKSK